MPISREKQALLEAKLEHDERVLWAGEPNPIRVAPRAIAQFLFGIFWTAFVIDFIFEILPAFKTSETSSGSLSGTGPELLLALFLLVGIGLLLSPLWIYWKSARTVYGITNKRVLIIAGRKPKQMESYGRADVGPLLRLERDDGTGDLTFAYQPDNASDDANKIKGVELIGIPHVRDVEAILRNALFAGGTAGQDMRYTRSLITLGVMLWLIGAGLSAATPTLHPLIPPPQVTRAMHTVPRYGKFEAAWTLAHRTGNPFDPAQNDIDVQFRSAQGQRVVVPAFWDGNCWKVRFAPTQAGRYTLIVLKDHHPIHPTKLTSNAFQCVPSQYPGFLRRDQSDPQHFQFTSGQGYYPVGINQAWTEHDSPDYPDQFARMHASHLNWARLWMSFWDDKALDWAAHKEQDPPIGQIYLPAARRWDMIMDTAALDGVYVQMCLQHHGQYTNGPDSNWSDNPANVANGGYLAHPEDFFSDSTARRLTRAKFRYIVARWGYSTHLMAYELFNEVQNITEAQPHFDRVVQWHREMAKYLRSLDPNHHMLTTSISDPGSPLARIGLDYDQVHAYVPNSLAYFAAQSNPPHDIPVFTAEFGPSGNDYGYGGLNLPFVHDGLWASLMTPQAGAGMMWYWEMLTRKNWWPTFQAVGTYANSTGMATQSHLVSRQVSVTGTLVDLPLEPPLGWAATTTFDVRVTHDGLVSGMDGVSSFIQGNNHRDMLQQPVTYHLQGPTQFILQIGTVAKDGASPVVRLDGTVVLQQNYPASATDKDVNETVTTTIPPGQHTVSVFNTGADWFSVKSLTLTHYAPALAVLAKGNAHSAFFWVYTRDRLAPHPIHGTMTLPGLADGIYTVRFWNTTTGKLLRLPLKTHASGGHLTIPLPPVTRDLAGSISRN